MKKIACIILLAFAFGLCIQPPVRDSQAVPRGWDRVQVVKMTSTLAGTTDQMYTVTGGRIEIVSLFGECTVDAGSPGNALIQLDATDGSGSPAKGAR